MQTSASWTWLFDCGHVCNGCTERRAWVNNKIISRQNSTMKNHCNQNNGRWILSYMKILYTNAHRSIYNSKPNCQTGPRRVNGVCCKFLSLIIGHFCTKLGQTRELVRKQSLRGDIQLSQQTCLSLYAVSCWNNVTHYSHIFIILYK